jgi:hypothetical protein
LFCRTTVKEILTNVLFAWAKLNPGLGYRQGMNELLAVIVFVGYAETEAFNTEGISPQARELLRTLNNRAYLEADCFWLFSKLMDLDVKELFSSVFTQSMQRPKGTHLFEWSSQDTTLLGRTGLKSRT